MIGHQEQVLWKLPVSRVTEIRFVLILILRYRDE